MDGGDPGDGLDAKSRAAAAYIADLTGNLAKIARNHGLETLSYVLEIARLEAETLRQDDLL